MHQGYAIMPEAHESIILIPEQPEPVLPQPQLEVAPACPNGQCPTAIRISTPTILIW